MSSITVSKSGGLIYHYDHNVPPRETEKTFSFPLDIKLELEHKRIAVVFGERDGIKIGHSLLAVNGTKVKVENGKALIENDGNDGKDVFEVHMFCKDKPNSHKKIFFSYSNYLPDEFYE